MDEWIVGKKEVIHANPNFNLEFERLKGSEISKCFNAENFKFKVSLHPNNKGKLVLSDDNVNYVLEGLLKIFERIRKVFKKRNGKAYIQINLTFDGLKKVYLKSGIINLFDRHSKNIVYWLVNQLDQVEQSSDDLVFSNNFVSDFIVIQTNHPSGKMDFIYHSTFRSSVSKKVYLYSSSLKLGAFFNNLIKRGYVDMKMYFNDIFEESNCIFISIYFGILYHKHDVNFNKTISFINEKFESTISFENDFKKQYKITNSEYLRTKEISFTLNYISNKIKKDIFLFSITHNNLAKMYYATGNYKNKLPIKLLVDNNHCLFIFDKNNLEKKRFTFCDFCRKSYSTTNISMHKCKREKCMNCYLYTNILDKSISEIICNSKYLRDTHFECQYCNKIIENQKCQSRHEILKSGKCMYIMFCKVCNKNYSKTNNHECGKKFCKKCLAYHASQLFCSTKLIKKKRVIQEIFLCDFKFEGGVPYLFSICQFDNSKNICIYQFINNFHFYTKTVISCENFDIISVDTFKFEAQFDIENIIQELDIINVKPILLFDKNDFDFLMNTLDLQRFELSTKNNHVYKMLSKFYTICNLDQYIYFDVVYILKLLNLDICPLYLIETKALDNYNLDETLKNINIDDFTKEYKHSDVNMFKYIQSFNLNVVQLSQTVKKDFLQISSRRKLIILFESFQKINIFIKSIADKMDIEFGERINNFEGLFKFPSFSSAVFSIFVSALHNQKLPTLGSITPGTIFNTSKYEISLCEVLNKFHNKNYTNHTVKSYVNGDGQQYNKGRLSVDWYCEECEISIFVEGNFKYYCEKHEKTVKHVFKNKDRHKLAEKGKIKRKLFIDETQDIIKKTYIIAQCCIMKDDYNEDFKNSNLYYPDFGKDVLYAISMFKREEYQRMNFQNALSPAFTLSFEDEFISDGKSYANKYDINSAYLSVLTHTDFKLPSSNIQDTSLVNKDANTFFHELNLNDKNFAFVKAFVVNNASYKLPFIPIKIKSKIIYSNCSTCLKELSTEDCSHTYDEKGHFIEVYLNDLLYMKSLGYEIKVTQIIYFKSKHNKQLAYLANILLEERRNDCNFIKKIAKTTALIALGRFALNISKISPSNVNIMSSNQELSIQMEIQKVDNIAFFNKYALTFSNPKISNFENLKRSTRLNCSSLMFGLVSSFIRKEMFEFYIWTESSNMNNIKIIRMDTDSFIVKCKNRSDFDHIDKYIYKSKFEYKLELSEIMLVLNFSRKSHFYSNISNNMLKVCGLRISCYDRNFKIGERVNSYLNRLRL